MPTLFDAIANHFPNARRNTYGFSLRDDWVNCHPAEPPYEYSITVSDFGDGKIGLYCHSRHCDFETIKAALESIVGRQPHRKAQTPYKMPNRYLPPRNR